MNITIATPWRQHEDSVLRYETRVKSLTGGHSLRFAFLENDSTDRTYDLLQSWAAIDPRVALAKRDTGGPLYPSIVHADRFRIMGMVFNWTLDLVDLTWSDYVLFLPCDIAFAPDMLERLLAHRTPIVAPFVFQNGLFYDIWAFSRNGHNFMPFPEEVTERRFGTEIIELDTLGGVTLIDADVLRAGARYSEEDVDRGFCRHAKQLGFSVWADPTVHVYHGLS